MEKLTLAIDVGGSGIKSMVLKADGTPHTQNLRVETPKPAKPEPVIAAIADLANIHKEFNQVSVGFPGVVRQGITKGAINLHPDWDNFDLGTVLYDRLGKPVRIANDADVQGLAAIAGRGTELVITLGTGFGSALFIDGRLVPNLELGQHQFRSGDTYEDRLGQRAFDKVGQKLWNRRLNKAIDAIANLFNYDYLYIGGGNAKKIALKLPENVKIVPNIFGLIGGLALWSSQLNHWEQS
ncbi:transcriptional regulator/sugar kinase [Synechococcus sp. PCC 7502]|uniref:ROK family protein n=1 Tax=Synechococcus sp. PCC 7502 TaxID=1173263 RepID=UPI00029F9157|nr:ROK family protein [Synechococcus sp. PCC 7502]AFY72609.1 transcriptional regulator/sugar kinase [Synechococcus sp. PCC 7502]